MQNFQVQAMHKNFLNNSLFNFLNNREFRKANADSSAFTVNTDLLLALWNVSLVMINYLEAKNALYLLSLRNGNYEVRKNKIVIKNKAKNNG